LLKSPSFSSLIILPFFLQYHVQMIWLVYVQVFLKKLYLYPLLLYLNQYSTASESISFINTMLPISVPSQRRFIKLVEDILSSKSPFSSTNFPQVVSPDFAFSIKLSNVSLTGADNISPESLKLEIILIKLA